MQSSIFMSYAPLAPEIIIIVGALALLLYGAFANVAEPAAERTGEQAGGGGAEAAAERVGWMAILLLIIAGFFVWRQPMASTVLFDGNLVIDGFGRFMKLLALTGSAGALLLSFNFMKDNNMLSYEYPVLVLMATVGMMLMISAGDLITLYLGMELQSLALYVVAALRRDSARSSEAGLKYFVLGALSSGMLLYGASLIYGFIGSTSFAAIRDAAGAAGAGHDMGLIVGLVFLLVGLAFKISAVPFHMWTPDVYEGAPTPVTAFLASAPKIAGMALLIRVVQGALPGITSQWQQIIVFLSIASMVLGAFAAIGQTNIKRLIAYSAIGHMGFALVGLAAANLQGTQGVLIYLAIYLVTTLGTFACILSMRRADGAVEEISDLAGLAKTNLPMAALLAVLFFSLTGIPPLAGFFAKFYVFAAAIKAGLFPLAIIGVVASVIGAVYYLYVVKVMFFDEAKEQFLAMNMIEAVVLGVSGALIVIYVAVPRLLVEAATAAAKSFF